MNQQEFIDEVKKRLGEELPDDLVFEVKGDTIYFYNKPNPELESSFDIDGTEDELMIDRCLDLVRLIKTFHTK